MRGLGEDDESALLQSLARRRRPPCRPGRRRRPRSLRRQPILCQGSAAFAHLLRSAHRRRWRVRRHWRRRRRRRRRRTGARDASTLHALALARVDSLAAEASLALKVAAAIGQILRPGRAPRRRRRLPSRLASYRRRPQEVGGGHVWRIAFAPRRRRFEPGRAVREGVCTRRRPSRCAVRSHPSPPTPSPRWRSGTMRSRSTRLAHHYRGARMAAEARSHVLEGGRGRPRTV